MILFMCLFVRYKVHYKVLDDSGEISLVFFNDLAVRLFSKTAAELANILEQVNL